MRKSLHLFCPDEHSVAKEPKHESREQYQRGGEAGDSQRGDFGHCRRLDGGESVEPCQPLGLDLREGVCPRGGLDGGQIIEHEGRGDDDGNHGRGGLQEGRQREPTREAGSPLQVEEDASGDGRGKRQFGQGVQFGE